MVLEGYIRFKKVLEGSRRLKNGPKRFKKAQEVSRWLKKAQEGPGRHKR